MSWETKNKSWSSVGPDPIVQTQIKLHLVTIHRLYSCNLNKFSEFGLKMQKPIYSQLSMNFTGLFRPTTRACMTHGKKYAVAGTNTSYIRLTYLQ